MDAEDYLELNRQDGIALWGDHPAVDDPHRWSIGPVIRTRDSSIIEESNADALVRALERAGLEEWKITRLRHWACGWVEHLSFAVYTLDGAVAPIVGWLEAWNERLEIYPVADEDDVAEREYDAAIESIELYGRRFLREDAERPAWAGDVYRWLSDNSPGELDDRDGQGPCPSEDSVLDAMVALGLSGPENDE